MNKIPQIFTGSGICIICEGDEEYEYLEKLISLDVWSKEYLFQLENAEGNGNIPARYQDKYTILATALFVEDHLKVMPSAESTPKASASKDSFSPTLISGLLPLIWTEGVPENKMRASSAVNALS